MALTHNGTQVNVAASLLPSGYTKPTVTDFDDYEIQYLERQFTIAKSTVDNATDTTTMGNIITQLNTDIETLLAADIDTTGLTVTSYAVLKALTTNDNVNGVRFTNGAVNYVLTVNIYVKTA